MLQLTIIAKITNMKDNISFAELAKKRQSDRKYKDQAVEREKIIQCLETARISPSANNSQPWKFVVVDDFEKKEQIAECSIGLGMNKFTHQCPVIVAVVLEKQNFMSTIGSMIKNKDYSLFDIGIAVNQFCLQAADLGLGTCIIGWFDEKKIKKILGVRNRRIPLLISVGYPDAPIRDKVRKPLEMMSSWNEY